MSRILICKVVDIVHQTNYKTLYKTVSNKFKGRCPNFGNKLWYQGIISEISVAENTLEYYRSEMDIDEINSKFDLMIYPMANIFSLEYSMGLDSITDFINKLRIPVFIISCGVQAKNYDELDALVDSIGSVSKRFIKAVYDSGGEFALRGYFTAEFFKKLGFYNPAVVGCPSLFQLGGDLSVPNKKVDLQNFKLDLNGAAELAKPLMKKYDSIFYDQEAFFDFMYNEEYYKENSFDIYNNLKWLRSSGVGLDIAEWIDKDKIRLLADMWDWQHSIQNENITFSYGTRIHGNIMAILSGVPALIVNVDARVKEMAEFYEIPSIDYCQALKIKEDGNNIYDMYLNTDYTKFNRNFVKKYTDFNDFLVKCGIVQKNINSDNPYLNCSDGNYPISAFENSKKRASKIIKHRRLYSLIS